MKSTVLFASMCVLTASIASAQAPAAAGQKVGLALAMQRSYAAIKQNLTEAAEKFGDADYAFKPNPENRTFGGQLGHVANYQFGQCAAARGVDNPNQGNNIETKTTKADIVKGLADSFAFCDPAFSALTDESAMQMVKQGQNEVARAAALMNVLTHNNEEYGVITQYIRAKAMVPPSTERSMRGRGMGK